MTHKTASLWKYVKTAGGWRYCKPVIRSNHKIDPRRVLVKGKIEEYPSGVYCRVLSVALRNWGRFYAPASFARRRRKGARLRLRSSTEKASGSKWSPSHSSSSSC